MKALLRGALRLSLLGLAAVALPGGSSCDGNLGGVSTGPVSFRVSVASNFTPANGQSSYPSASRDGNLVAFASRAGNLAPSPTSFKEIFVRNRLAQTVVSASKLAFITDPSGAADCDRPMISADGLWLVFESKGDINAETPAPGAEAASVIYRKNIDPTLTGNAVAVILGPGFFPPAWPDADCVNASISEDGGVVVFESRATNLATTVPYANPGFTQSVFVADFRLGSPETRLVSRADGTTGTPAGTSGNARVSADGNWIVFESTATNLLPTPVPAGVRRIYRAATDGSSMELVSRQTGLAGAEATSNCISPSPSRDGSVVSFLTVGGGNLQTQPDGIGLPVIVRDLTDPLNPVTRQIASDSFIFFTSGDRTWMSDDGRTFLYSGIRADGADLEIRLADAFGGGSIGVSRGVVTQASTLQEFPQVALSGDGRWAFWWADFASEVFNDTNDIGDVFGYGPLR